MNDKVEIVLALKYGEIGDKLHTALNEVVEHFSEQINLDVGSPKEILKRYGSTPTE